MRNIKNFHLRPIRIICDLFEVPQDKKVVKMGLNRAKIYENGNLKGIEFLFTH